MNSGMLDQLMNQVAQNKLQGHPIMNLFNQMMHGKSNAQKWDTLLNAAQNKGIDINAKTFTEQDLKRFGLRK